MIKAWNNMTTLNKVVFVLCIAAVPMNLFSISILSRFGESIAGPAISMIMCGVGAIIIYWRAKRG